MGIQFRGEEISILEAKVIQTMLKLNIYYPSLSNEEKTEYEKWAEKNKDKKSINLKARGKPFMIPVNERGYLMQDLYFNLKFSEIMKYARGYEEREGLKKSPTNFHPEKFGYAA